MSVKQCAVGVLVLLASVPEVYASSVYVGGAALRANRPEYEDVDASTGAKAYLGLRFDSSPIFIEASYLDSGKATIDNNGSISNGSLRFNGYTLGGGLWLPLANDAAGVFVRGAYYGGRTRFGDDTGHATQNASGGSFGLGLSYKLGSVFGLRAEYENLIGVKDFSDNKSIAILSLGAFLEFGAREPATHRAAVSADEAAAAAAAYAAIPEDDPFASSKRLQAAAGSARAAKTGAAAPAPAVGTTAAMTTATATAPSAARASLKTQAALHAQARAQSPSLQVLPAGTTLQISQPLSNSDGTWWFADAGNGVSGWINDSALTR